MESNTIMWFRWPIHQLFEPTSRLRVRRLQSLLNDDPTIRALSEEMLDHKQIKEIPSSKSEALIPVDHDRWRDVHRAFHAIEPMFWGPRWSLEDACHEMRQWIANEFQL